MESQPSELQATPVPSVSTEGSGLGRSAGRSRRLGFGLAGQGVLALALLFGLILLGIVLVMNTYGKSLVVAESRLKVVGAGNQAVEQVRRRTAEAAAVARSIAATAPDLAQDAGADAVLSALFRSAGDPGVVAARYQPLPVPADAGPDAELLERLRQLPPGSVVWSDAHRRPDGGEPVVTGAVAAYRSDAVLGIATVDLRLSALAALAEGWQEAAGGYAFLVDGQGRFLSSEPAKSAAPKQPAAAGAIASAGQLATRQADFRPIAESLGRLAAAGSEPALETVSVARDFVTGEESEAFLFPVPGSTWRLALVSSRSSLERAAAQLSRSLVTLLSGILVAVLLPLYLFLSRAWIRPVTTLAEASNLVREGDLGLAVEVPGRDEIGELADSFNSMVGQMRAKTESLEQANAQLEHNLTVTDTIMGTVREGLFLLDPELRLGPKYSAALEGILGRADLTGKRLPDLLRTSLPERTFELTERFLRLLFNPSKNDSVIAKINPLREVETAFAAGGGALRHKYLSFTFDRIREGGAIVSAMVTVTDVTARIQLAVQLKQSQERLERQAELLLSVMHVDPQLLREFVEGAQGELAQINELLKEAKADNLSAGERNAFYQRLIDQIYRRVHGIKGTAALLRIDYYAAAAHRFEDKLSDLRARRSLDGNDFVPVVLELSRLSESLTEIREVIERFAAIQHTFAATGGEEGAGALKAQLERFVGDLAERAGKEAALVFRATDPLDVPMRLRKPLQDVLAQLVRNSIAHGIEPPLDRAAAGKPRSGIIEVSLQRHNGHLEVMLRDDGRGLDYQRVAERVREMAKTDPELFDRLVDRAQNRWRPGALEEMVFHPGFTTMSQATGDAGRGYGLNTVKESLTELGGKIQMRHRPGQFCEFHIVLPVAG
ncbi:MAG TPA: ATP-binding protein [Thermoanaerobaculia bacterium]|nr:ATP-binding protein [Thermoanaerobaculia bacterium]